MRAAHVLLYRGGEESVRSRARGRRIGWARWERQWSSELTGFEEISPAVAKNSGDLFLRPGGLLEVRVWGKWKRRSWCLNRPEQRKQLARISPDLETRLEAEISGRG